MKCFVYYLMFLLIVCVGIVLIADVVNRKVVFSSDCSAAYKMYRMFKAAPADEIPILGSSRAQGCYVPSLISSRAFSYGQPASRFGETVFHLKSVLNRKGPGLVIVNLEPWGLSDSVFRCDYRLVTDVEVVKNESQLDIAFLDCLPGIRFYGEFRKNLTMMFSGGFSSKVLDRGAVLMNVKRTDAEWNRIFKKMEILPFVWDVATGRELKEVLAENKRHEVVFVIAPVVQEWWRAFPDKDKLQGLKDWLLTFPHVHVFDCAGVARPHTEFFDAIHLNLNGAQRFTNELTEYLREENILRKDKDKDWDAEKK